MDIKTIRLTIAEEQLREIMQAFYTVTNIKSTLYDTEFREILTYPKEACNFCKLIRGCYADHCRQTDQQAFEFCAKYGKAYQYYCHAGLCEVILPLRNEDKIIGYIMFGQMVKEGQGCTVALS